MSNSWTPASWRTKRRTQGVEYDDCALLRKTLAELSKQPPLVAVSEIEDLKRRLAEAQSGRRFLLQGGDCCERFDDCRPEIIAGKLDILLKMGQTIAAGYNRPVVHVGRIAGQYAKPRSAEIEVRGGASLPSYRGDMINLPEFTAEARRPDPRRLSSGYQIASRTLHYIRALRDGEYLQSVYGKSPGGRAEFFTSHEGLHLDYEESLTRLGSDGSAWYDTSTHLPWLGHRTGAIDGAHVEFFRGIANPIGLKVGPTMTPDELIALIGALDPCNEPGRLCVIHRFGVERIESCLPPLVEAVRRHGKTVLWCCDPMHGNTRLTRDNRKTRHFDHVLGELQAAFEIHAREGSILGGVHFELTGENVTECLGGPGGLSEADLGRAYLSDIDPRLNKEQALELAAAIARWTTERCG
mgnify:CR=1 FL=1